MKFTFYSMPGCPQCKVLKMKLDAAGVEYTHIDDVAAIAELGYKAAPVLIAGTETYCGPNAIKWFTQWVKNGGANGN